MANHSPKKEGQYTAQPRGTRPTAQYDRSLSENRRPLVQHTLEDKTNNSIWQIISPSQKASTHSLEDNNQQLSMADHSPKTTAAMRPTQPRGNNYIAKGAGHYNLEDNVQTT